MCRRKRRKGLVLYKNNLYHLEGNLNIRKYFRPTTCMSNLYKLTMKCHTAAIQDLVESKRILCENQMGTVQKVQRAKE